MWELAERQYGVIARWQLKALGYGSGRIDWLRDSGALERVMCGVYRIPGSPRSWHQRVMIHVLAAGPGPSRPFGRQRLSWASLGSGATALP